LFLLTSTFVPTREYFLNLLSVVVIRTSVVKEYRDSSHYYWKVKPNIVSLSLFSPHHVNCAGLQKTTIQVSLYKTDPIKKKLTDTEVAARYCLTIFGTSKATLQGNS